MEQEFDNEKMFMCQKCNAVIAIDSVSDDINITCCGEIMTPVDTVEETENEFLKCKECGTVICIEGSEPEDGSTCEFTCCDKVMEHCSPVEEERDEDETILVCKEKNTVISVVRHGKNEKKLNIKCSGIKMETMNEDDDIEEYEDIFLKCEKCGTAIFVNEMPIDDNDYVFTCCDQEMVEYTPEEDICTCGCETEHILVEPKIDVVVSVIEGGENCNIKCNGNQLIPICNTTSLICKKCGNKISVINNGEYFKEHEVYNISCCGEKMEIVDEDFKEESKKEDEHKCCCHDHSTNKCNSESDSTLLEFKNELNQIFKNVNDSVDDLTFLYCPKCHKRVTVAEEPKSGEINVECCGEKMVNLDEVQSYTGYTFACKKCGIEICVEEDCSCYTDDKEHGFVCCGEKMEIIDIPNPESCSDDCCSCCGCDDSEEGGCCSSGCCSFGSEEKEDGDCCTGACSVDTVPREDFSKGCCSGGVCSFSDDDNEEDNEDEEYDENDEKEILVCPKCKRIVSVVSPCKNEKCDGVFCCGEKMQSLSSLTDKAGKYFKCKKCGTEYYLDADSMYKRKEDYKNIVCCGEETVEEDKEYSEEDFHDESNSISFFCTECERLVALFDEKEEKPKPVCCGKKMIDLNESEDSDGEMYVCKKCGLKLIIENHCLCGVSDKPCQLVCCGTPMKVVMK